MRSGRSITATKAIEFRSMGSFVADSTPYDPSYAVEAVIKAMEPPAPVSLAAIRAAKAAYDKRYPKGT